MKSVVVTGASTGIGWSCVKVLVDDGFRVFGGVRKEADADRLAKEFGTNFTPLTFDVTAAAAVAAAAGKVRTALGGETLFGLVNNAGIGVGGPLLELSIDEFSARSTSTLSASSSSPKPLRLSSASTAR
jgi:NAD(P)-dependent dehydrogenase (short-subunit alcohol dehydrogenase family)